MQAAAELRFGSLLTAAAPYLAALLGLLLALALLLWLRPALRAACLRRYCDWRGMRGLSGQLAETRLAAALAMALQSGLNAEEALELATPLAANSRAFRQRCAVCAGALADGHGLAESLARAELFPAAFRRMLALAAKSGACASRRRRRLTGCSAAWSRQWSSAARCSRGSSCSA